MDNNNLDIEIARMRSLIERMSSHNTGLQGMLNEDMHINEGVERQVETPDRVFDVLSQIGKNSFVCVGYVTGANLNLPKVKRLNPETNRMKSYDDYETFGKEIGTEGEIGALVKITSYNYRYYTNDDISKKYADYSDKLNNIRSEYGIPQTGESNNVSYTSKNNYGGGVDVYSGDDESKQGNFYVNANTYGASVRSVTYAVGTDGHIMQELTKDQVKPYLKEKGEAVSGVGALRKMGAEEDRIQSYIEAVNNLKFKYTRFEGNSILWVAATVNKQRIVYINSNLAKCINGININAQDFVEKARERYNIDVNSLPE